MLKTEEHLDNLLRHINLVREACILLGKRLISKGQEDFARILIANGHIHDASKFHGIEWEYLHAGKDVPKDKLDLAIMQHQTTNSHHPEYWGGFENMPAIAIAEMACDLYARSQEFGTGLREWIKETFVERHDINTKGKKYKQLMGFVDLLLENEFK